ncbi:MAG: hypothetical protein IJM30_10045 [Thermoguttaceae bacterium]|nr:hypothetical protein [Thermoguttaceae bacterium]
MYNSRALFKLLRTERPVISDDYCWHIVPDGIFTVSELEELREIDEIELRENESHIIANFLSDGERPEGVPDYEETLRRAKRSEDDPKRT